MQHRNSSYIIELDQLADHVSSMDNMLARRDLGRMLNAARNIATDMDRELVECRRLNRYTSKYVQLESKLEEQLRTISKWLTWAHLRFS